MGNVNWVNVIVSILTGLAIIIPLAEKLVKTVKAEVQEKNWPDLMSHVIELMKTAEEKFKTGAERKEWVIAMVKATADTINYQINYDSLSKMIDDLCDMSKTINSRATSK